MMRQIFVMLTAMVYAFPAFASCSGPSPFDALPQNTQAELRHISNQVPYANGILWQAEKNGVTSYIVGTMHVSDPRLHKVMQALDPHLRDIDHLFLEMTAKDEVAFMGHLTRHPETYLITTGPSLVDRLGETHWQRLLVRLNDMGMPGFMAARYQPWFLGLVLSVPPCMLEEKRKGRHGLDRRIEQQVFDRDITTSSLDTTETLLEILASDPIDRQVEQFQQSLSLGISESAGIESVIAHYFAEETQLAWEYAAFNAYELAGPENAEYVTTTLEEMHQALVVHRNTLWLEKLSPALSATPSLVAVGALHLPGDAGILSGLKQQGFTITRLPIPKPAIAD